jgi:hypothetical protein
MKGRTIALGEIAGRKVAALIVDGQLDDLLVERAARTAPPRARSCAPSRGGRSRARAA